MTGLVILGGMVLGLGLLALGGKKKKSTPLPGQTPDASSPGQPQIPGTQEGVDWSAWVQQQVMQAAQSGSASTINAAARLIESQIPQMPAEIQSYARQAVAALRAQAASLGVDTGATAPPYTAPPMTTAPPVSTTEPIPTAPTPSPSTGQIDWPAWIQERVMQGATSGVAETANRLATEIESRIPTMPTQYHAMARQAVDSLRNIAKSWQSPSGGAEEPVFAPQPPEPPPDPVMSARAQLAQQMTANLKQNGGAPANRYKEDRELVKRYQAQEGLTIDGLYGVGTGLTVVKYGIVPARPYYFSKDSAKTLRDKAEWKRVMQEMAGADPARSDQWLAAANVDSL